MKVPSTLSIIAEAGMRAFLLIILAAAAAASETFIDGRRSIVLGGESAELTVDIAAGSFVDFHIKGHGVNPLSWKAAGEGPDPRPMGHYLCLDRWGAPTAGEAANGMPFHGEAARVVWSVDAEPAREGGVIRAQMSAMLPIAGLEIERRIELAEEQPLFTVVETVTNRNGLGRVYNMVQHPSIAAPFLDKATVVDANAGKGLGHRYPPLPDPEQEAVLWPDALKNGQLVDERRLVDGRDSNCASYVIEGEYGWTTAASASNSLLLGYVWKTSEYPWFSVWRNGDEHGPVSRAGQFGTTGMSQPFSILLAKSPLFGRPLYAYLDAGESVTKSYACFLLAIPADYRGVGNLDYIDGQLILREYGEGANREQTLVVGNLF